MAKVKKIDDAVVDAGGEDSPLRISTIIQQHQVGELEAAAVMAEHGLKATDRIEPQRFLQMIAEWKSLPTRRN